MLFVREGPYASLTARFSLSFPVHAYTHQHSTTAAIGTETALGSTSGSGSGSESKSKFAPPLLTFQTDVFHPLIVPLTTYTFSGGGGGGGSEEGVSSKDVEERLPPGAFRVRWGGEGWFADVGSGLGKEVVEGDGRDGGGRDEFGKDGEVNGADIHDEAGQSEIPSTNDSTTDSANSQHTPDNLSTPRLSNHSVNPQDSPQHTSPTVSTTLALLHHLHASFTKADFLDTIPLSHAANTSAWHAWRSYRDLPQIDFQMAPAQHESGRSPTSVTATTTGINTTSANREATQPTLHNQTQTQNINSPRHPRNWNWDGLFESRVSSSVRESNSDFALYGHLPGSGFGGGIGSPRQVPVGLNPGSGFGFGPGVGAGSGRPAGGAGSGIKFEKLDRERLSEIRRGVRLEDEGT